MTTALWMAGALIGVLVIALGGVTLLLAAYARITERRRG